MFCITIGVVEVHRSARKHGVAAEDALHAAGRFLVAYPLEDENQAGPRRSCGWGRIGRAICWRSWCCCSTMERD